MKTQLTLKMLFALLPLSVLLLIACQKEASGEAGPSPLKIYLTDHQTPVFDSVFIDMQKLEVKLEDDTLSNGGWVSLSIRSGVYNILRFRNGLDTLFANGTLPNNQIRKVRLTLGTQNSVMRNGQSLPLKIKDKEREVVINLTSANFDVNNGQLALWLDFDAGNSIRVDNSGSGNNNGFELKPHIKAFGKRTTGRIEGRVSPLAANAIVKAVIGTDTATAIPESRSGEFKIIGLNAGMYKVIVDGQNGYLDTTINNVRVVNNEDTKLPPITLRQ
ncbi:MAG: DUF4382 domain-containing protein [Chitinophagaceae bacterium]|nr:MAG: DUF4382 domain-containing protein [Chitinophagaceae bacterium]